jgi:hypothetical protein
MWIFGVIFKNQYLITIVAIESVSGANPNKSPAILKNHFDRTAR